MRIMIAFAFLAACGNKQESVGADDKPKVADTGLAFEPMKLTSDKVIVEAEAPKGWSKTELTPNDHSYADPKGGITPSTITISATCPGECNTKGLVELMVGTQKSAGYDAKVTKSTELPNGLEVELDVTKAGSDPFYQYVRFIYDPKLPVGAQCLVMGTGSDAKAKRDAVKAACAKLSLKAK